MYELEVLTFLIWLLALLELARIAILILGKAIIELVEIVRRTKSEIKGVITSEND
jgi:hypothetical protein